MTVLGAFVIGIIVGGLAVVLGFAFGGWIFEKGAK